MKITITVADNMSAENFARLCDGIARKYGEAEIEKKVDNGIIGGFIAEFPDMTYDYSIKSRLDQLERHIRV